MNNIKGFTFYKSYYESLKNLKEKDKKEIINAILEYIFDDKIPNFNGTKKAVWALIEPNLNTSKNRSNPYSGAPYGNSNASKEKQSKNNQKTTSDLKDKDKDKDKDKECVIETSTPTDTDTVFNFCFSNFGSYDKDDLEKSCKKFFNYYQERGWKNVKNWQEKLNMWIEDDIESKKIKRSKKRIEVIDGITYEDGIRIL
jgi:hypothetical protein